MVGAGPGRALGRGDHAAPSAGTTSSCSRRTTRSAASSTSPGASRARRSSPRRSATTGGRLELTGVKLHLATRVDGRRAATGFDEVVLATGVTPADARPSPASTTRTCCPMSSRCRHGKPVGARVAVIGAGGIGFDVSEFLTHRRLARRWTSRRGAPNGAWPIRRHAWRSTRRARAVARAGVPAAAQGGRGSAPGLGKTTGWVHRAAFKAKQASSRSTGVNYERIDDDGLHITLRREARPRRGCSRSTTSSICAGQEPRARAGRRAAGRGVPVHLIGGADVAAELDAKRAIDQGTRLAATL